MRNMTSSLRSTAGWRSHALLPALSLQPARNEMPEENGKLVVSDEVIKQCNSTVPDATRLAPVRVQYNEGTLPPTLVPVNASGADGARRAASQAVIPAWAREATWPLRTTVFNWTRTSSAFWKT